MVYSPYSRIFQSEAAKKTDCVQDYGAEINSERVIVTYAVVAFT